MHDMDHAQQLSGLAGMIAAIRAQGRTVRLALHNTERFGLVHLYFVRGRLTRVEGHAGDPARNLLDLAAWSTGAMRVDRVEAPPGDAASPATLEAELARTVAELERRGVVYPAPPAVAWDTPSGVHRSPGRASGSHGLPPLDAATPAGNGRSLAPHRQAPGVVEPVDRLSDPQWQLLALAVRQVAEHVGQLLGGKLAESILRQALARLGPSNPFLAGLYLDETGWLHGGDPGHTARFSTFDAVEAVAALLTQVEFDVANVVGPQRAQQLIAGAVAPFRTSLEQIGLAIRAG
jgi:hypothetical protein